MERRVTIRLWWWVRDEYLAWVVLNKGSERIPQESVRAVKFSAYSPQVLTADLCLSRIDYYGVTFDHLVPADDANLEVLALNIVEVDSGDSIYTDGGTYANEVLLFSVDPEEYTGKKVLAVLRCCQHKRGSQDRRQVNGEVAERDSRMRKHTQR